MGGSDGGGGGGVSILCIESWVFILNWRTEKDIQDIQDYV